MKKLPQNGKQMLAAMHARALRLAKENLREMVNQQLQYYRSQGLEAEITPQIQNLLSSSTFRTRIVNRMNTLAASPEKVRQYIYATNKETGEIVSGEAAIARYNRYATSKIAKPAREEQVVTDNFVDAVSQQFVDDTAYQAFVGQLDAFMSGDYSGISESDWGNLKTEHDRNWVARSNQNNVQAIRSALNRAIERRGLLDVMRAINTNPKLMDNLTAAAASGYREKAGAAMSEILEIFNPNGSAFDMGDMQSTYESQYEDSDFEE